MKDVAYRFLEPLDVLFLRGNKLFGDPGSFGESLIPPWPSVAAGAIRSRMLVDAGIDLAAFAQEKTPPHPDLGTPNAPGPFTVTAFHLARRALDGQIEILVAPPADVVIGKEGGRLSVRVLRPTDSPNRYGIVSSYPLPQLPVLPEETRSKPAGDVWLTQTGWDAYLRGEAPRSDRLVDRKDLWAMDTRVGVGLDAGRRAAADGRLFTVQAISPRQRQHHKQNGQFDVGFVVGIAGATPPRNGLVRLGGDGRAAAIHDARIDLPEPDYEEIARNGRCRIVLTTPGIFEKGWLPTGVVGEGENTRFELAGVKGRIVAAAVPRAEVVSGWDLARWQPKPAQRVAPTGSVYWLELDEGVRDEALRKLAVRGLWPESGEDSSRRAEGFNRIAVAAWTTP